MSSPASPLLPPSRVPIRETRADVEEPELPREPRRKRPDSKTRAFHGAPEPQSPAATPRGRPLRLASGQMLPGTRYRLIRWVGEGGMGVVYEAEHVDIGRRVALKILRADASLNAQILDMFRAEARTLGAIGSAYIVEIFDFGELVDGRLMYTMELVDGPTLRDVLADGPLEPGRAIGILRQVCKGLQAAHDAGIVHHDVKPENILLARREGRPDSVKLLDFGIAAFASELQTASARAGTPEYTAPEVITGLPHDGRADVYAFGCTAYEAFAGAPPFEGDPAEVLGAQLQAAPRPLTEVAPEGNVRSSLEAVIARCLAKAPDDRFASFAEVEAALCEAQIDARLHSTWDDLPLPDMDPARRDRLLRAMPDPTRLPTSRRRLWLAGGALTIALGSLAAWGWLGRDSAEHRVADAGQDDHIDELIQQARAAAAKAYFVYPPPDRPDEPTAYSRVLELEALGETDPVAARRAVLLRQELATTLVRLGDRYWDAEGGKPFSIDYYAAALVLDPDEPRARERAVLSPGQLASLQQKAETRDFTQAELEAVEPLVILAEEDKDVQRRELARMRARHPARAASTEARLDRLVGEVSEAIDQRRNRASVESMAPVAEAEDVGATDGAPTEESTEPAEELPRSTRDPKAAAALASRGRDELRAGRIDTARRLFEQAIEADSRSAAGLIGLSQVSFEKGHYARAAEYAERAVRRAPRNADYRIQLGDAYYKSFRYGDAQTQYARAEELGSPKAAVRLAKVQGKH